MEVGECRMRIIAGRFRGRRLSAPVGEDTRPTSDRVRESVFSSLTSLLGPDLGGGAVLDAFSGSGALALEALSRGCRSATAIESDHKALAAIRANAEALDATGQLRLVAGDVFALATHGSVPGGPFALILIGSLEMNHVHPGAIHALGAALVIARVCHVLGLKGDTMKSPARFIGAMGTLLVVLISSVWTIVLHV